ncbi:MAG: hypothetical protein HY599_01660 [Candidatus Omnitrophica bacterium]|nr:hypothetical protein [Candidatus Omnitrophota bacterium]
MKGRRIGLIGLTGLLAAGCVAGQTATRSSRTIGSAAGEVAGTIVGRQYGDPGVGRSVGSQLGGVAGDVAGSAIESRGSRPTPARGDAPATKFCPVGGELYPETFKFCPLHGGELRRNASN